jgi:hypothetical protein
LDAENQNGATRKKFNRVLVAIPSKLLFAPRQPVLSEVEGDMGVPREVEASPRI